MPIEAMRENLFAWLGAARTRRMEHETTWQEIQDLFNPFRGDITTLRSEGTRRISALFDSTGMVLAESFVSFLKGAILPAGTDWVHASPAMSLENDDDVLLALEISMQRLLTALDDSNFYVSSGTVLRDLSLVGNSVMLTEEAAPVRRGNGNTFGGFSFDAVPFWDCWWQTGRGSKILKFAREYEMPAQDAFEFFNGNPGKEAMSLILKGQPMEKVRYTQFVFKNPEGKGKPWLSHWYTDDKSDGSLRESGFDSNPYVVSRWNVVAGMEYGHGHGHLVRPDAKSLNKLMELVLKDYGMKVFPPIMTTSESHLPYNFRPGTTVTVDEPERMIPQPYQTGSRPQDAQFIREALVEQMRRAFMADILEDPDTQPRSAEESEQRKERSLAKLSGPADKVRVEWLTPVLRNCMEIMLRTGALPELQEVIDSKEEVEFEFSFTSPFFSLQKQSQLRRTRDFVRGLEEEAALVGNPAILDNINYDEYVDVLSQLGDIDSRVLNDDESVEEIRAARAQREQTERLLAAAQQLPPDQQGVNVA